MDMEDMELLFYTEWLTKYFKIFINKILKINKQQYQVPDTMDF